MPARLSGPSRAGFTSTGAGVTTSAPGRGVATTFRALSHAAIGSCARRALPD